MHVRQPAEFEAWRLQNDGILGYFSGIKSSEDLPDLTPLIAHVRVSTGLAPGELR
jgi:hypothetical protein